jgi:hypothetical protein
MMLQMSKIFLGLVFWNTVLFGVTAWTGYTQQPYQWRHFGMGLLTAIYTCLTHCIVMMHFMGSGRGIKEAVESHGLANDPQTDYVRRTRQFKALTSPAALFSCLFIMTAAVLGAWTHTSPHNPSAFQWHRWLAWVAVAYNLYAFRVEYRAISENTAMIRDINRRISPES